MKRIGKALLGALLVTAVCIAGTPGDTSTDSMTYCDGPTCTTVTFYYELNADHQWVLVGMTTQDFPNPNYRQPREK